MNNHPFKPSAKLEALRGQLNHVGAEKLALYRYTQALGLVVAQLQKELLFRAQSAVPSGEANFGNYRTPAMAEIKGAGIDLGVAMNLHSYLSGTEEYQQAAKEIEELSASVAKQEAEEAEVHHHVLRQKQELEAAREAARVELLSKLDSHDAVVSAKKAVAAAEGAARKAGL